MGTFVTYQVASGPAPGRGTGAPSCAVSRRFRDFAWLSQKLTENNKVGVRLRARMCRWVWCGKVWKGVYDHIFDHDLYEALSQLPAAT
eukprot:364515-Chlamydomonas_euryale.AAC.12